MKIDEKSMKFHENPWNPCTYMGYICFGKRRWVIFYILKKYTPRISVLQREINWWNRENGNQGFSGKHGLWPVKHMSKWLFPWKPEMIPRSIQTFCPSRFLPNPPKKLSFGQQCWNPFFPKVWDSFLATYSISWQNSCGNFNENPIGKIINL